ncbi:MAG: hydroxyisourate hydrolase [Actinomycetota bacterium]|nr:hydroxyisourate hydrolase [Actinomycetota bacterium]
MSSITTHVLDLASGRPAEGVGVALEIKEEDGWRLLGAGATDGDGRLRDLLPDDQGLETGTYRLTFDTGGYFDETGTAAFYPEAVVTFRVAHPAQHYHVPLLLSPFGYSTYRGS